MKRFNFIQNSMKEDENGQFLDISNCVICTDENMYMGGNMDILNKQIQEKTHYDGPFNVMIIMEETELKKI